MSITGSSKSATVKEANSKIAVMLRKREEDDALLTIGKRKTRDVAKNEIKIRKGKKAKNAFQQDADFSFPTPLVDRPRTADGSQSFHFSFTTISKTASPTSGGKPLNGFSKASAQPALDHSKYIERDGAAELSAGVEHAAYIERASALESVDPSGIADEAVERDVALLAGEGLTAEEAAQVGPLDEPLAGIPSVFSNISNDPFEREEFWRAVYRTEYNPRTHLIQFDMDASPKWWAALDADSNLDPSFKAHALQVKEAYRQHERNSLTKSSEKPFEAKPYPVSSERAGTVLLQSMRLPGFRKDDAPTTFESGRGGRAQIRFVAELPHELTPEDRALIVQNFTDHLGSFSTNEAGQKIGLMYTAVVHAPDIHNDNRNYHLHVVAHDRPAKFVADENQWDFEIQVRYLHKRQERIRYPLRQNKIGEASRRPVDDPRKAGAGRDFIPALRTEFARITNAVLEARGIDKRYDPRRYTEMGIERDPTEHLGTKAAALEAAGVPTPVGKINAIKIWRDAEQAIERNARAADALLKKKQKEIADLAAAATAADPRNPALMTLREIAAERQMIIDDLADDRRAVETFDHLEAKAKSRAVRTRQTCIAFLADIRSGKAKPYTTTLKPAIEERFRQAQAHIARIDAELVDDRAAVTDLSRSIVEREQRVAALDRALEPITANLKNAIQVAQTRGPSVKTKTPERVVAPAQPATPIVAPAPPAASAEAVPNVSEILPVPPILAPESAAQPDQNRAAPDVTSTPTIKEPTDGRPTNRTALARVFRIFLDPRESGAEDDAPRTSASPLSRMRGLSSIGMVQHHPVASLLLHRNARDGLGRRGAAGDELRRPGSGDRENAGGRDEALAARPTADPKLVELAPAAIEGAPIVAPSLPPRAKIEPTVPPTPAAGLDPLRPPVVREISNLPPETIIPDIDKTVAENATVTATKQPVPIPSTPASVEPVEPKTDGRRRVTDPTLFEVHEQKPPIKPGTARHAHADWDALFGKISGDRFLVAKTPNKFGGMTYSVPSLSSAERDLLNADSFASRTNNRLGSIYEKQKLEINRVVHWISTQGQSPDALILIDRSAKFGAKAPASIKTLMTAWRHSEDVMTALRQESTRRIVEEARALENDLPMPDETTHFQFSPAQIQKQLDVKYPDPKIIVTSLVKSFSTALRSQSSTDEEIEAIAREIKTSYGTREDVMRYGPQLAEAYAYHLKGSAARAAELERANRIDRGWDSGR